MSKAFTSEETPEAAAVVRPPPRLRPGEVRYVTPEGHAALRAALARARADRAEAAAAPEGPGRAARVEEAERRAAALDGTLAVLTVLDPARAPEGRVAFGTWVTVEDEAGARLSWRIVGPDEADAARGLVSVDAPVGRALLGREVGDAVEVERPRGRAELTVLEVRRTPP